MRTRRCVSGLRKADRLLALERAFVEHPNYRDALRRMEKLRTRAKSNKEDRALLISGLTGMGKTTLCEAFIKNNIDSGDDERTIKPTLYCSVPKSAAQNNTTGAKSLAQAMLLKLGEPLAARPLRGGTLTEWSALLYKQINNCGVEMIILDEFQHLVSGNKIVEFTADWVKELINEGKRPVVLCGLPECLQLLDVNSQLASRCKEFPLMPWDFKDDADRKTMRRFLYELDYLLPLEDWSGLYEEDTALRIYQATTGLIGHIMKLYRGAGELAIEAGATAVTRAHLADAFNENFNLRRSDVRNPFVPDTFDQPLLRPGQLAMPAMTRRESGKVDLRKR